MDSNHRPHAYQACALTTELYAHLEAEASQNRAAVLSPLSEGPLLRKEVIQPHLPIRLPCYDFTPIMSPTFDGCAPFGFAPPASGVAHFRGVTGGVYKARERIHRGVLIRDY